MWKWFLKQAVKALAEPIVDAVIMALEEFAQRTENSIDDALVKKIKEFKEALIGFILGQADNIAKKA